MHAEKGDSQLSCSREQKRTHGNSIYTLNQIFRYTLCNEVAVSFSASLHLAAQLISKKCRSDDEPLAIFCPIGQARDLNLRPPVPEMNMLSLEQLACKLFHIVWYII